MSRGARTGGEALVVRAHAVRRAPVARGSSGYAYITQDRVDPARVCAPMPTGVVANVKDLEAKGFGFIKPDNGEAASRRARAHSRPLSAQLRSASAVSVLHPCRAPSGLRQCARACRCVPSPRIRAR